MTENNAIPQDFKGKINWLFENIKKPDGKPWSNREVGLAIGKTENYIWRLRTDPQVNNPSLKVLRTLAEFFGVSMSIFDAREISLKEFFGSEFMGQLALRAPAMNGFNKTDQQALLQIIDSMSKTKDT